MQAGGEGTPLPYRSFEGRLLGGASSVEAPTSFIIAVVDITWKVSTKQGSGYERELMPCAKRVLGCAE